MALFLLAWLGAEPLPVENLTYREGTLEVIGRYKEFLDGRLILHGSQIVFIVDDGPNARALFSLTAGKDSIQLTGRFVAKDTVQVESISKAPPDVERFVKRGEASSGSSAELFALGREAISRAERFGDTELKQAALDLLRRGFLSRKREVGSEDPEAHLAWVEEMVRVLGDKEWAMIEGRAILERHPGWEPAERFLRGLDCVKWRGGWLSKDDFLKAQGYVNVQGGWVLPEDLLFAKARSQVEKIATKKEILRAHTDDYYRLHAEKGKILTGMTREEAVSTLGFPDHVSRIRQGNSTFDQWRYGTDFIYFLNDHVAVATAEEAAEK